MKHKAMYCLTIAKTHFGFCRMHIHIHQGRIQREKQHIGGMSIVMQHVLIGLAHRVAQ